MANRSALKTALLVGGAVLAVLFVGQVLNYVARLLARLVANVILVALVAGLAYGVYRLYAGWNRAGSDETTGTARGADAETPANDLDEIERRYVEGDLNEQAMERQLEHAMEVEDDGLELEYE